MLSREEDVPEERRERRGEAEEQVVLGVLLTLGRGTGRCCWAIALAGRRDTDDFDDDNDAVLVAVAWKSCFWVALSSVFASLYAINCQ